MKNGKQGMMSSMEKESQEKETNNSLFLQTIL